MAAVVEQIRENQEILEKMKKIFADPIMTDIIRKQTEFMNAKEKNVLLEPHLGSIKNNASILVTTGAIEQKKHDNIIKLIQEKDLKALKEEIDPINIEQQREDKVNYNQKILEKMKKIIDDPITTDIIRKQAEFMDAKEKIVLEPHLKSIKDNASILVIAGDIKQKKHDNIIKLIQEKDLKALKEEIDPINIELKAEETLNIGGKKRKSRKRRRKPKRKSRKRRRKSRKKRRKSRKKRRKSRKKRRKSRKSSR